MFSDRRALISVITNELHDTISLLESSFVFVLTFAHF